VAANKRLVFDAWREIFESGRADAAARYVAADYIEHDPNFESGREALARRIAAQETRPVPDHVTLPLVAVVGEGDLVVVVTAHEHPHPERQGATYTTTGFDMFRIANGLLAEHWSGDTLRGAPPPSYGG
jgi:predicted SnoaL-like aldol condensation-catalyzing enzyme